MPNSRASLPPFVTRVTAADFDPLKEGAKRSLTEQEPLGALNLYAGRAQVFDAAALDIAAIYAIHAASALEQAELVSGLQSAMQSRHVIGIAQGVLAVRYGIAYDTAFEVLRRLSNELNVKLRDLAQQVADQRGLPDVGHDRSPLPPV